MLIRSQDKRDLLNFTNIQWVSALHNGEVVLSVNGIKSYVSIGKYSTEEKAFKVIDMIQRQYADFSRRYGADCANSAVFQMPLDSEV